MSERNYKFTATPIKNPVSWEFEDHTQGGQIARALQTRSHPNGILTKGSDRDFVLGMEATAGLVYVDWVLKMLEESDSVKIDIVEVAKDEIKLELNKSPSSSE